MVVELGSSTVRSFVKSMASTDVLVPKNVTPNKKATIVDVFVTRLAIHVLKCRPKSSMTVSD